MSTLLAYLNWDPSRFLFTIPGINWPLGWYGMLFAGGFIVGYFLMVALLKRELALDGCFTPAHITDWTAVRSRLQSAVEMEADPLHRAAKSLNPSTSSEEAICKVLSNAFTHEQLEELFPKAVSTISDLAFSLTDKLCWCVVAGTIIGARLGHVFLYEWHYYSQHLSQIPKVWEGGLASHGGIVGIILSLFIFNRWARKIWPSLGILRTMDLLAIPSALVGFCIRLGNFFNQEIVGTVTTVPWAVLFAHPAEGVPAVPRHPVQLYEGVFYLVLFVGLVWIWRQGWHRQRHGLIIGLLFSLVFVWRFFMEFFKEAQGGFAHGEWLQTGQVLSIPLVMVGLWFIWRSTHQTDLGKQRGEESKR